MRLSNSRAVTGFLEKFIIWEYNKSHTFLLLGDAII